MRTIRVTRYVTPLREGGSLPAIVEADDDGLYVLKFRAAGQGPRALVAELVAGEIARALGLPVPEIVFAELDRELARTEPDPEIHALIHDSAGLNLALDFLPGAVTFDPVVHSLDPGFASRVVWFDGLVTNVDRTARNTNMLMWHRQPWLIDHGATLYVHHTPGWEESTGKARDPFPMLAGHVLRARARQLAQVDGPAAAALGPGVVEAVLDLVPDVWLASETPGRTPAETRAAYVRYLRDRLEPPRPFLPESPRAA
ncbi:MAG: HipA family kinase [Vicinamibacterales bacterium]